MIYDLGFKNIFLAVLIFFLAFGWLVLLFSATGLFYTATIALSILASLALTIYFLPRIYQNINMETGKTFYFVALVSLAVSLATCYFATPTIFGGRDQGAIATAAINLSEHHSLTFSSPISHDLFEKYGSGRALNFPGFDYTKNGDLISRFPAGFTSYLAANYNLFGIKGIRYANFVPLFLFLVIFWLVLRKFFDEKISFLGFAAAASFFPFQWFAKYALTEIYMLFLVWAGVYFLLLSLRSRPSGRSNPAQFENTGSPRSLRDLAMTTGISLAFFALASFVRIEGLIFFLLAIIYIFILERKKLAILPKNFKKYLLISTAFLIIIYIYLNFPALLDSAKNFAKAFLPNTTKDSIPSAGLYTYLFRIFFSYNILPWLVLGLAGIAWGFFVSLRGIPPRRGDEAIPNNTAKTRLLRFARNDSLTIFFILFPSFFYLITPQITLEDPWLLRRFVFAVFPALIFYSIYALEKFFYHKIFLYIALVALVGANLAVSARFFTLSENKNLLPQIEKLSGKFTGRIDLILVDRLATGSGFSLASEPMRTIFGKPAVYFFNANDLKYIDRNLYNDIYLVAPIMVEKDSWYAKLVENNPPIDAQIIDNNFLEPSDKKFGLAVNVEMQTLTGIWKLK